MVHSMFSLDHRLSELRPSGDELRLARQLREASEPAPRPGPGLGYAVRGRLTVRRAPERPSRLPAS